MWKCAAVTNTKQIVYFEDKTSSIMTSYGYDCGTVNNNMRINTFALYNHCCLYFFVVQIQCLPDF